MKQREIWKREITMSFDEEFFLFIYLFIECAEFGGGFK